jgi:hypothetical protein
MASAMSMAGMESAAGQATSQRGKHPKKGGPRGRPDFSAVAVGYFAGPMVNRKKLFSAVDSKLDGRSSPIAL